MGSSVSNHSMVPVLYLISMPDFGKKLAPRMTFYLQPLLKTNASCCSTTRFLSSSGNLFVYYLLRVVECFMHSQFEMGVIQNGLFLEQLSYVSNANYCFEPLHVKIYLHCILKIELNMKMPEVMAIQSRHNNM